MFDEHDFLLKGNYNFLCKGNTFYNKRFTIHKFSQNVTPHFTMNFDCG